VGLSKRNRKYVLHVSSQLNTNTCESLGELAKAVNTLVLPGGWCFHGISHSPKPQTVRDAGAAEVFYKINS